MDHAQPTERWLMPATLEVERLGQMRFIVQPRWATGPYETWGKGFRRRAFGQLAELELEVRFDSGSLVALAYVMPYPYGGRMVATSFGQALEPLRLLMYGPKDEAFRKRVWDELYRTRPLFMALNDNGLHGRVEDLALQTQAAPISGTRTNMVVSVDPSAGNTDLADESLIPRITATISRSLELLEESTNPLSLSAASGPSGATDGLEVAGAAAKWVFNNAGKIKDAIELVRLVTG